MEQLKFYDRENGGVLAFQAEWETIAAHDHVIVTAHTGSDIVVLKLERSEIEVILEELAAVMEWEALPISLIEAAKDRETTFVDCPTGEHFRAGGIIEKPGDPIMYRL